MSDLKTLGLGKTMAQKLRSVGIATAEQLRETCSREAVRRLKEKYPGTCVVILYHLESALRGVAMGDLDPEVKSELKTYFKTLKLQ